MSPRPTREDLDAAEDAVVPDLLPDPLRLLVVGINPGLWSGATGAHFARPGNRFFPALAAAGITERLIDPSAGYDPEDLEHLRAIGLGVTNLVRRSTARADQLEDDELRDGARRLVRTVLERRPAAVAVAGISAFRVAFGERRARQGLQERWPEVARSLAREIGTDERGGERGDAPGAEHAAALLETVPLFVVPNPSGLNAHATVASLAAAYREAADAAGMRTWGIAETP